jgi:hypothetical protein
MFSPRPILDEVEDQLMRARIIFHVIAVLVLLAAIVEA